MPKYSFTLTSVASAYVDIEADDLDTAIDLAYENTPSIPWIRDIEIAGDWEMSDSGYEVDGVYIPVGP